MAAHRVKKMEWKGRLDVRKQLSSRVFFPLFFFFFFFEQTHHLWQVGSWSPCASK